MQRQLEDRSNLEAVRLMRQPTKENPLSVLRSFFLIAGLGLLSGCAGDAPKVLTCSAMNWRLAEHGGPRIEKARFSVDQPASGIWCLTQDHPSPSFFSHPTLGQPLVRPPSEEEMLHTLVLMAAELRVPTYHLRDADDLETFVDKWLQHGQAFRTDGDLIILDMTVADDGPLVASRVWRDDRDDAECVRYETERELRNHPKVPDRVLALHDYGMVCRAPGDEPAFVMAVLTERQIQDDSIDPGDFDGLKRDVGDPFFRSLRFDRPPDLR